MSAYVPLWVKSNGSFLEGASHPDELVDEAQHLGLRTIAITDREGVYGVVRAHVRARELGVRILYGAEICLEDEQRFVLLVQDRLGWASLCELLSVGRRRAQKGACLLGRRDLERHHAGLLALYVGEPIESQRSLVEVPSPDPMLASLREVLGDRLYALVARHRRAEEVGAEARLRALARRHGLPVVAGMEVLYHHPARRPLQDVVTCIRHQVKLSEAGRLIRANDEHALKTDAAMNALFADDPSALARTREVAGRCTFSLDQLRYRYPSERLPTGRTSGEHLRDCVEVGAHRRYGEVIPDDVRAQLDKELQLILELDYCGYFLTMREIVEFCERSNILCQGRGSAANSVVCYCLGITAVDPVRMKFLFERFISKERAEPPDIDLDIEHARREEAIQHMYEKYGRSHAAMVANVIRYRGKSSMRDVGRVLGIAETTLDRMSKLLSHHDGASTELAAHGGLDPAAPVTQQLFTLAAELEGFPRHLSIHPGGFLLGHDPVSTIVPIENATMADRTVIQWDKDDVEALGLFKVDLLALGALTHLHGCFDLLKKHQGIELGMASIPEGDPKTYDLICRGDTVGVFQIESRAQMSMLPRLRPSCYYDLVIQISIVRPGPITGGMVHPYLRRRNGDEIVDYPHELLRPVLEKTLGVPLFQEQVMRVAMVAADYTPGEADQLRRDMAAWRKGGKIEQHRERLISRMSAKGITPEFAERVYKQICGFGEYGFPESHAASFALVSYAGSYLRAHHPAVFTCGLLNAQPMGFYSAATIVEDAKRHGVAMAPICVTRSADDCTLEGGAVNSSVGGRAPFVVRMGLRYVRSMRALDRKRVVAERERAPFTTIEDFAARCRLDTGTLAALAESGALAALSSDRRGALWQTRGIGRAEPVPLPIEETSHPAFSSLSRWETIEWDYRRTSHSTEGHPLEGLRPALRAQGLPDARTVASLGHGRIVRYAGMVICRQRPGTASGVVFMTLEDETGFVNVICWQKVFEKHAIVAKTEAFLGVTGRLQIEDGVTNLIADALWRPDVTRAPVSGGSRDFH